MNHSPTPYAPDDGGISVSSLEFLNGAAGSPGAMLRAAAVELSAGGVTAAGVAGLRKGFSTATAGDVAAALTLARLQEKGREKFLGLAFVWGTPEALEQASGTAVARWKARRFVGGNVLDFCAGIGGDALGFAQSGLAVTAVEMSAVRARCLEMNAAAAGAGGAIEVRVGDLREVFERLPREGVFHIDPARRSAGRRSAGRRSARYEDVLPGPEVIARLTAYFRGGAIKLSPAVDFESLPEGHVELISYDGVVVQAVVYVGEMAPGLKREMRTATVLSNKGGAFTMSAVPCDVELSKAPVVEEGMGEGGYLYEVDGAVTRAKLAEPLLTELGLMPLTPDGGYACGERLLEHDALTGFRVCRLVEYSERRVGAALKEVRESTSGAIEVKCRGRIPGLDPNALQIAWTKTAATGQTVLVFAREGKTWAVVGRRVAKVR